MIQYQEKERAADSYQDHIAHLFDELRVLTYRLLRLLKMRNRAGEAPDSGTRGLFIEEEEILSVLNSLTGRIESEDTDTAELDRLTEEALHEIAARLSGSGQTAEMFPLRRVAGIFGLTPLEVRVLIIAIAPEIDRRYERVFAFCNDDLTRKAPTVGLALELLCDDPRERVQCRRIFSQAAPLLTHNLIRIHDSGTGGDSLQSTFTVDDRIRRYILGDTGLSQPSSSLLGIHYPENQLTEGSEMSGIMEKMLHILRSGRPEEPRRPVFWLHGKAGEEKFQAALSVCREIGLPLLSADLDELIAEQDPLSAVRNIFREAALQSGFLFLWKGECLYREGERSESLRRALLRTMAGLSWVTFISAEDLWMPEGADRGWQWWYPFAVDLPPYAERRRIWSDTLAGRGLASSEIDALAGRFAFSAGKIREIVSHAMALSEDRITADTIYQACNALSGQRLSAYAKRVRPHYRLDDIVLPEDRMSQVMEICGHIRHRHTVYFTWGFEKKLALGKGLNILFSGPSGTGKTMTADIIANEFNLGMYQVDLSSVVSKYIGETEKNLSRIFREAASGDVILFFDEADALFGKRTETKDAHDRYANIEINYLLQKMEEHEGIVILSTNLSKNLDEAFLRRLHFTVEFPFPEEKQRLLIWQRIFPGDSPLADDIDYPFLAERFRLPGGNIRNVAVTAAFYAAGESSLITMRHIILAVKREMQKMGKLCVKGDFGKYYELIDERCTP